MNEIRKNMGLKINSKKTKNMMVKTRKGGPVTIEVKITNEQLLKRTRQETTTFQIKKEHNNGLVT